MSAPLVGCYGPARFLAGVPDAERQDYRKKEGEKMVRTESGPALPLNSFLTIFCGNPENPVALQLNA
jgi:hypothetical protein